MKLFFIILGILIYVAIGAVTYIFTFDDEPLELSIISFMFGLLWPFVFLFGIIDWIIEERQVPFDF